MYTTNVDIKCFLLTNVLEKKKKKLLNNHIQDIYEYAGLYEFYERQ